MSSWYVFASMGFFPNAGQDIYLVSGPLFPYIEINRENGSKIIIETENYSKDNIYVKALTLNGKSIDRAWIKHHEIANGAHLKFTMDSKPSDWGKKNTPPNPSEVH